MYHGEDCILLNVSLREHPTNVINFEKKKMSPLTKIKLKLHQDATACYICLKIFKTNLLKMKFIVKLETLAIIQVNTERHSKWNLKFNVPNEISVHFHNGLN